MKKIIFFAIMMVAFAVNAQNYAQVPVITTTTTVDTIYQDAIQPTTEYKSDDLVIAEATHTYNEKNDAVLWTTIKEGQKAIEKVKLQQAQINILLYPSLFILCLLLWFFNKGKVSDTTTMTPANNFVFYASGILSILLAIIIVLNAAKTITTITHSEAMAFSDSFRTIINSLK